MPIINKINTLQEQFFNLAGLKTSSSSLVQMNHLKST